VHPDWRLAALHTPGSTLDYERLSMESLGSSGDVGATVSRIVCIALGRLLALGGGADISTLMVTKESFAEEEVMSAV